MIHSKTSWSFENNLYLYNLMNSAQDLNIDSNLSSTNIEAIYSEISALLKKQNIEHGLYKISNEFENLGFVLDCGGQLWSLLGINGIKTTADHYETEEKKLKIEKINLNNVELKNLRPYAKYLKRTVNINNLINIYTTPNIFSIFLENEYILLHEKEFIKLLNDEAKNWSVLNSKNYRFNIRKTNDISNNENFLKDIQMNIQLITNTKDNLVKNYFAPSKKGGYLLSQLEKINRKLPNMIKDKYNKHIIIHGKQKTEKVSFFTENEKDELCIVEALSLQLLIKSFKWLPLNTTSECRMENRVDLSQMFLKSFCNGMILSTDDNEQISLIATENYNENNINYQNHNKEQIEFINKFIKEKLINKKISSHSSHYSKKRF